MLGMGVCMGLSGIGMGVDLSGRDGVRGSQW